MQTTIKKFAAIAMIASVAIASCGDKNDSVDPGNQNEVTLQSGATIEGTITKNTKLVQGGTYTLKAGVHVKPGATLTIPAGVTVKSSLDASTAYLLIEPGAKIEAVGTATAPIVFTSGQSNPKPQDWGGIILCGKAPINVQGGTSPSEMGAGVNYGGTDAADNSGTLKYVRVEYTGKKQTPDKEHNGFTFEGVGNGTTVEYISSYRGGDDGIEWFGGTVNAKYLVVYGAQDDMFDYTFGWSGKAQFLLGVQEQVNNATFKAVGDRGFECDNNGGSNALTPWSNPTISNVTIVGSLVAETGDDPQGVTEAGKTRALKLRAGTRGQFYNLVATNFFSGVEVEHDVTLDGMASGGLNVKNSDIVNAKPWAYKKTDGSAWTGVKPFETADYKNNTTSTAFPSFLNKTTYVGTNATDAINPTTLDAWFTAAT
ncbi:MAG TPA: hypothetical protein VL943_04880, partial [Niabella sp.]|nr:hypothetical protein [Niabella sp.]